jgi:hypothetical protein
MKKFLFLAFVMLMVSGAAIYAQHTPSAPVTLAMVSNPAEPASMVHPRSPHPEFYGHRRHHRHHRPHHPVHHRYGVVTQAGADYVAFK